MLKDKQLIQSWLDEYGVKNYTINDDFTVDVKGNVDLNHKNLKQIPVQFNYVTGNFSCHTSQLTSLKGCPITVVENFYCGNNQLTSLEYCPVTVVENFYCDNNQLTSLEFCPKSVGEGFYCQNNQLISLEGCPQYLRRDLYCNDNQLTSLDFCPESVGRVFYCNCNPKLGELQKNYDLNILKAIIRKKSMEQELSEKPLHKNKNKI